MDERALCRISYGLFIVSSKKDDTLNGQIANCLFQVTAEPPTVAISINRKNFTHECIKAGDAFSISILGKNTPLKFIGPWGFKSGRDINKFENVHYTTGKTGVPIVLDHTVAYIEANVIDSLDVGTHTIFVGKVGDAQMVSDEEPMTYLYYYESKCGYTPKNAPTYIERPEDQVHPERAARTTSGDAPQRYRCTVCNYIYDPAKGAPDSGIPPGTAFEDIPDDWVCPICGVDKSHFIKEV